MQYAEAKLTPDGVGGVGISITFLSREARGPTIKNGDRICGVPIVGAVADILYFSHDLPEDVCFGGKSGRIAEECMRDVEAFIPAIRDALVRGAGLKYNPPSRQNKHK